ncbi:unnamed protein product [Pseudo-nitzschia multistriata]|uniref:peptide-methionine (S)-S-oxide reductase n=1 Tax=Pseudo-nitzschia multistriata TaxID=183589 RepID=A0A448ZRS8_9STRA|nr:unnamed protein product [Pseudo-nitzschia multistriata]
MVTFSTSRFKGGNSGMRLLLSLSISVWFCHRRLVVDSFSPQGGKATVFRPDVSDNPVRAKIVTDLSGQVAIRTTSLRSSPGFREPGANAKPPSAVLLVGTSRSDAGLVTPTEEERGFLHALEAAGYGSVGLAQTVPEDPTVCCYELSRATGMLRLLSQPEAGACSGGGFEPPRWVPMVRGEENVLVANGWSFLDPDESEPVSAFDIDDASAEAEYRPKWGAAAVAVEDAGGSGSLRLSPLGYDVSPLSEEDVLREADTTNLSGNPHSRGVLLHGRTDPPNTKTTCNGIDFRGSAGQSDIPDGVFFAAIGGLPLFSSKDLSPTTGSSGWLSFARPLESSHVLHIDPEEGSADRRIEVVCARTRCHLGHYFGPIEGYCINASALRFVSSNAEQTLGAPPSSPSPSFLPAGSLPTSWRSLDDADGLSPSHRLLKVVLEKHGRFERVCLGCGCFWHVEQALLRLPGIRSTTACYAGGHTSSPVYKDVSGGSTGHAEVVSVVYDPGMCPSSVLFDCFLAMHDPTKVRAHGKHALNTGQYRSCVFVEDASLEEVARGCTEQCRSQLGKELSTDIRLMGQREQQQRQQEKGEFGHGWCWRAEDRHQRHDERIKGNLNGGGNNNNDNKLALGTLTPTEWLREYGRRTSSIVGGVADLERSIHPDDDGMAMMMI